MLQFLIAFAIAVVSAATAKAADPFDANKFPFDQPDLKFPFDANKFPFDQPDLKFADKPRPVGPDLTMMFKPIGDGPFPALVIMPTCAGHTISMHAFDWAQRARFQGYAVLVVDPLTPRRVSLNCESPSPVPATRVLKDAFDAANHLRRQSFVDPTRVGLMGFSQGGMVALAASGSTYSRRDGTEQPFRGIFSAYPICILKNLPIPGSPDTADFQFVPEKINVPILVAMGDQDNEDMGTTAADCKPMLDKRKAEGDPISYIVYHATHIWDWREMAMAGRTYRKNRAGEEVKYEFNPDVTEQSAKDAFAFLDKHVKGK
jgi:dienelactone hydrolase